MKTFIKYPGGKSKELDIINANKPPCIERYFEPFLGGGSVFFDLEIKKSYVNDKSTDLALLFSYVKEKNNDFLTILKLLNSSWKKLDVQNWEEVDFSFISENDNIFNIYKEYKRVNEERKRKKIQTSFENDKCEFDVTLITITSIKAAFYYTIRHIYNTEKNNKLARVICYYFLREFCYSSMFRFSSLGDFNVPYGGQSYNTKNLDSKIELIENYDIDQTNIYNEDFSIFLKRFNFKDTDFIFVDPPYDSEFSDYDGISFDIDKQIALANTLSNISAKVMVVIKNTEFIHQLYSERGFRISSFDKKYSVNFQNRNHRDVKHLMITNY